MALNGRDGQRFSHAPHPIQRAALTTGILMEDVYKRQVYTFQRHVLLDVVAERAADAQVYVCLLYTSRCV